MFWLHTIAKINTSKAGGWLRGGFVKKALPGCFIPLSKRRHPGKRQTHSPSPLKKWRRGMDGLHPVSGNVRLGIFFIVTVKGRLWERFLVSELGT